MAEWMHIANLDKSYIKKDLEKSYLIRTPNDYSFFHPKKMVAIKGEKFAINATEDWEFKISRSEKKGDKWEVVDEKTVTVKELAEMFNQGKPKNESKKNEPKKIEDFEDEDEEEY